jgi:CRISPR-associated protein (TIGR02584 family)
MTGKGVLMVSVGLSPQVVTETLHALFAAGEGLPTRLILITTVRGANAIRDHLIDPENGQIAAWGREWGIVGAEALAGATEIVAIETDSGDIDANRGHALFACGAERLIRSVTECSETTLHVSIAGGRKTAGAILSVLMALHGRAQDRVTHILVEPETAVGSDFFFPTRTARKIFAAGGPAIDTSEVRLHLVDLPVTGLSAVMPAEVPDRLRNAFFNQIEAPRLRVHRSERKVNWDGRSLVWPPQPVAFLAMLVADRLSGGPGLSRSGTARSNFLHHYRITKDARKLDLPDPLDGEWVEEKVSRVNKLAKACRIHPGGGNLVQREGPRACATYRVTVGVSDIALL